MRNNRNRDIVIVIVLGVVLFLLLFGILQKGYAQNVYPNIRLRVQQDTKGYYLECYQECDAFNALGTLEEISKHYPELQCAVNNYYFIFNRKYNTSLGYLTNSDGDISNPLCEK